SGLNASSEEDLIVFYDYCGGEQINLIDPQLQIVFKLVQLHLWGAVDPKISYRWLPLATPTTKEEAEIRTADGKRDTDYVNAAVPSPDEVRERLRSDKTSGYSFITGDAPPPQLEQEAELDEQGKQADHGRAEESADATAARTEEAAQAQHKRDKELQ